jgi:hypothetical protein
MITPLRAVVNALFTIAVALFTIGLSAPARAGFDPCPDGPHAPPCTDYILIEPDYLCQACPERGLGLEESDILAYDVRWRYIDDVRMGLHLLAQAGRAKEPELIGQLRAQALKQFTAAASELGSTVVKPGAAGVYDRTTGEIDPLPMPWLATADRAIAAGLDGLTSGPDPMPWLALAPFDDALAAIDQAG